MNVEISNLIPENKSMISVILNIRVSKINWLSLIYCLSFYAIVDKKVKQKLQKTLS